MLEWSAMSAINNWCCFKASIAYWKSGLLVDILLWQVKWQLPFIHCSHQSLLHHSQRAVLWQLEVVHASHYWWQVGVCFLILLQRFPNNRQWWMQATKSCGDVSKGISVQRTALCKMVQYTCDLPKSWWRHLNTQANHWLKPELMDKF